MAPQSSLSSWKVFGEVSVTGRFLSATPLAITSRQSEWISPENKKRIHELNYLIHKSTQHEHGMHSIPFTLRCCVFVTYVLLLYCIVLYWTTYQKDRPSKSFRPWWRRSDWPGVARLVGEPELPSSSPTLTVLMMRCPWNTKRWGIALGSSLPKLVITV